MQLKRYVRLAVLVSLAVVTFSCLYHFGTSDSANVFEFWTTHLQIIPLVALLAVVDVLLEGVGWVWVYSRFGIRSWNAGSAAAFLSGRAGLVLPAQLGRLIRPDAMTRLGRGKSSDCLKAEAAAFVLDMTSVLALLAAWVVGTQIHPVAAPLAVAAVIAVSMILGNQLARVLSGTPLALPKAFWLSWHTVGIVLVEMAGWITHGLAFYIMLRYLPGNINWWDTVFFTSASAIVGAASGLPGGIGATEGLLGLSLRAMSVPVQHLAIAIGAFRLFTFWIWIPVGWLSLWAVRSRTANRESQPPVASETSDKEPIVLEPVPVSALTQEVTEIRRDSARRLKEAA